MRHSSQYPISSQRRMESKALLRLVKLGLPRKPNPGLGNDVQALLLGFSETGILLANFKSAVIF